MYTFETFYIAEHDGYGYRILQDGNTIITQEYEPDAEGYIAMSMEVAHAKAQEIIIRLQG